MVTFIGEFSVKVDVKGRFAFPVALKKQINQEQSYSFVVKEDMFEKCLVLFPMEEWERQNSIIRKKLNPFNKKHNLFLRSFAKGAAEVALDSNNRILIPKRLLDYANISKEIVLAGQNGKVEIWSKQNFDKIWEDDIDLDQLANEVIGGDLNLEL